MNSSLRLIEIRTYRLKPHSLQLFHSVMHTKAVVMLRTKGMDVVSYGASNHEHESYFLIRAYADRKALEDEQNAFYNSNEWKQGPRPELIEHIDTYMNTLIWLDDAAVDSIRQSNSHQAILG
jgi:NIPSNAP